MRNKTISISSDSCDDDIPLKLIKRNGFTSDLNCYDSLCKHSIEACEFCDKISTNRYSSLIHNVTHIIIPLLNQTVFQCPICLHSFTSETDLKRHNVKKHPETAPQVSLVNDVYSEWMPQSSSHNITQKSQTLETNSISIGQKESIKNRLVFEDDDLIILDYSKSDLLNDLTTDCKVSLEVFDTPWLNGETVERKNVNGEIFERKNVNGEIVERKNVNGETVQRNEEFKSVHYDELVKPGVFRCKKCGKGFPIRYDAIIHETSHIKFKNSQISLCVICKKYLNGGRADLRHHFLTYHQKSLEKINKTETEYVSHFGLLEKKKTYESKILNLCELCFSFCKNKNYVSYECIDSVSQVGNRFECEKCGQKFFEINLVRRSSLRRVHATHSQRRRKTNEDRLKTIASRLKKMKH